ncbi:UbiA prenyltransferase family protein [Zhouia amylolytica]|uniref:Prenyltransferase n=1 Tax=Zhouia amylolytica AD3 TaxID=1286632 RepID=W2UT72_9FLAO|nr:hypothetical protein [Zhouia amylolytica]ETN96701.1 hypothetical protein P278_01270 [Zhouia amylolytica AD3]
MQWIKTIFNFYIDASIHVALAVYALIQVTCINYNIPFEENLSIAILLGVIVSYNFLKYAEGAEKYLIVKRKYTKIIQFFSFACAGGAVYFMMKLPLRTWVLLGILTFISALYMIPISKIGKNIRSLTGIKVFIVASVWALITVVLPVLDKRLEMTGDLVVETVQRFLFVVAVMVPFEIRDLSRDAQNLKTIPQLLGVRKAKMFGILLMLLLYLFDFLKDENNIGEHLVLAFITILVIVLVGLAKENQGKYYSAFWVEGIPIVWWLLLLFF